MRSAEVDVPRRCTLRCRTCVLRIPLRCLMEVWESSVSFTHCFSLFVSFKARFALRVEIEPPAVSASRQPPSCVQYLPSRLLTILHPYPAQPIVQYCRVDPPQSPEMLGILGNRYSRCFAIASSLGRRCSRFYGLLLSKTPPVFQSMRSIVLDLD